MEEEKDFRGVRIAFGKGEEIEIVMSDIKILRNG